MRLGSSAKAVHFVVRKPTIVQHMSSPDRPLHNHLKLQPYQRAEYAANALLANSILACELAGVICGVSGRAVQPAGVARWVPTSVGFDLPIRGSRP